MSENNGKFEYTYTAPTERERKEVESLRRQYAVQEPKVQSKVEKLRALDNKVKNPPQILAFSLGVIGTLIFGGGLSMILEASLYVWGTVIALLGMIPIALAYPLYKKYHTKLKDKYRKEILQLTDEILNENRE